MIFFINRALRDILNNIFLNTVTIITIALSVLIASSFALFLINTGDIMASWKDGVKIMAYLRADTPEKDIPGIRKKINGIYGVSDAVFISKDEALSILKSQMDRQSALLDELETNPLPDAIEIRMMAASQNWDNIETLAKQIESMPEVDAVEYGQRWLGRFTDIFELFRLTTYGLGGVFFMAAVFIVANTTRLVLYTRREEVTVMRLVGATDRFIKLPFYIEGIIQGTIGGILGLSVLLGAFLIISANLNQDFYSGLFEIRFFSPIIFFSIIFCSMIVGWLGSYLSLKQFLTS